MISVDLLTQEFFHGVFAVPFAYLLWKRTGSWKRSLLVVILTYAIDLDHLLDYFLYYGATFNIFDFLSANYFKISQKAIVPLHAWEWGIILTIFARTRGWKSVFTIFLFSLLPHLIYDTITVKSLAFYSIIYRVEKNFINLN